jgi:mono/diheme cytochrome c family protein
MRRLALAALLFATLTRHAFAVDVAALERGHRVYDKWCNGCHAPNPMRQATATNRGELAAGVFAGTYALEQRYKGAEPAALEQRTDLASAYIEHVVRTGLGIMPRTRKTEISDDDLADLAAYLTRNNRAGDSSRAR